MAKDTFFNKTFELLLQGRTYNLDQPRIMGILNVNSDSFFDGGKYLNEKEFLLQTEKMLSEGADFIDVGGISSKPGSNLFSEKIELERILPVVKILVKQFPGIKLSVDTFRQNVAQITLSEGVSIINDISGGRWEPKILETVAKSNCTYVLMHSRNSFEKMHEKEIYIDLISAIKSEINNQINQANKFGLKSIIIDPGFGFSKNINQNFELLNNLEEFNDLNYPILAGISRKSMIWKTLNTNPENALNGTTALNMICLQKGAKILRVHDVKEAKETITLYHKMIGSLS
jgi:dihydropteroate synthase